MNKHNVISYEQIRAAIHIVRADLHWKPGSESRHLAKRIIRGHLPRTATLEEYEQIIQTVI